LVSGGFIHPSLKTAPKFHVRTRGELAPRTFDFTSSPSIAKDKGIGFAEGSPRKRFAPTKLSQAVRKSGSKITSAIDIPSDDEDYEEREMSKEEK
jgi:hypothetical protein